MGVCGFFCDLKTWVSLALYLLVMIPAWEDYWKNIRKATWIVTNLFENTQALAWTETLKLRKLVWMGLTSCLFVFYFVFCLSAFCCKLLGIIISVFMKQQPFSSINCTLKGRVSMMPVNLGTETWLLLRPQEVQVNEILLQLLINQARALL